MYLKILTFDPNLAHRQTRSLDIIWPTNQQCMLRGSCQLVFLFPGHTHMTPHITLLAYNLFPPLSICLSLSPSCSLPLITSLSQFLSTVGTLSVLLSLKKSWCSAPLLCSLMSYSSSPGTGFIKAEMDNSLSCSLELTTLVIPWEIFGVPCIKFVSLSHAHTHFYSFAFVSVSSQSIFQLDFLTLTLSLICSSPLSNFFSRNWTHFLSVWYVSLFLSCLCLFSLLAFVLLSLFFCHLNPLFVSVIIYSSFPQYLALVPHLSLSPSLFTHIKLYIPPELDTGNLPVGPVSSSITQLARLIDQWSSWIPQKVNY